jgi:competence protein ComEC
MSEGRQVGVPKWALAVPLAAMLILLVAWSQKPDGKLHLWVLDVGQGNALLLRSPDGHTAVIDGGQEASALHEGIGRQIPFWQNNLNLVMLTAPKAENVSGLVGLLGRRRVGQVVQGRFEATTNVLRAWGEAVVQSGADVHYAQRGDVVGFEGEPDVALHVLYPAGEDGPIVMRVDYAGVRILLAASLEQKDEAGLLAVAELEELRSEVLIVPDHGSDTALSQDLLEAVGPQVAIISVGEGNRGNDPSPTLLDRLEKAVVRIYRTDVDRTVEVIVDGGELWIGSGR